MKNILLIGSWTREHIIAEKLCENEDVKLFWFLSSKNPWILPLCEKVEFWNFLPESFEKIWKFAKENDISWAFIWPDNPIWDWLADFLEENFWIKSFAPKKSLAQIESSKGFTRNLVDEFEIWANPKFKNFSWWKENKKEISDFLDELWENFVIKYDSLFWWKWVKLSWEHLKNKEEWILYALECLEWCGKTVIEEKLVWEEFSLMSFTDWKTLISMPSIQDHKRAFDWDKWPNTWWMGSYTWNWNILPFMTEKDLAEAESISEKIISALEKKCWEKYKWILYWGFIITENWVKLIEYNARFWDPEVMNLLTLLETSLVEICEKSLEEKLSEVEVKFDKSPTVCKHFAVEGYPENPKKWEKVEINLENLKKENIKIYFWSIENLWWNSFEMWSSRAFACVCKWKTIEESAEKINKIAETFKWNFFFRKDIWMKKLLEKRAENMKKIRK